MRVQIIQTAPVACGRVSRELQIAFGFTFTKPKTDNKTGKKEIKTPLWDWGADLTLRLGPTGFEIRLERKRNL